MACSSLGAHGLGLMIRSLFFIFLFLFYFFLFFNFLFIFIFFHFSPYCSFSLPFDSFPSIVLAGRGPRKKHPYLFLYICNSIRRDEKCPVAISHHASIAGHTDVNSTKYPRCHG